MRFINKKFILFMTNVFLLAGIGTTIANYSTSVVIGEAFTTSIATSITTGSRYFISATIPSGDTSPGDYILNRFNNNSSSNFSPTALKYNNLSELSFNNTWLIRSSSLTDLEIYYFDSFGDKIVLTVKSTLTTQSIRAVKDAASTWTLTDTGLNNITLGNNQALTTRRLGLFSTTTPSWRNYLSTTTTSTEIIKLKLYKINSNNSLEEASDFADEFLFFTNLKNNLCTAANLNWSSLESSYAALSNEAKYQFLNSNEYESITNARARYNYLISFNNLLNDFVFGV